MTVELIICYMNNCWATVFVDASSTDTEEDIIDSYTESYKGPELAFVGIYNIQEDEE